MESVREGCRREFLKFLLGSPVALAAGSSALLAASPTVSRYFTDRGEDIGDPITTPGEAVSVFDFERVAATKVPPAHFGYLESGVDGEMTLRANRIGFERLALLPRRLIDVSRVDMSTEILGVRYASPIMLAPIGGHKAYHPDGEIGVAAAARTGDHLVILSNQTTTSVKDVIAARAKPVWFQLYPTDRLEVAKHHVSLAEKQGATAIVVTVDALARRNQETFTRLSRTDTRPCSACHDRTSLSADYARRPMYQTADLSGLLDISSPTLTWDFIKRLREMTRLRIVIKGVLSPEDAQIAAGSGVDAVIVSNHGGRTIDHGLATIVVLPEIVQAAGGMPVLVDSGFRRGTDICKALCLGAKGVAIGRPYIWGLGAFGQAGVEKILALLRAELLASMREVGATSISDLRPAMVVSNRLAQN